MRLARVRDHLTDLIFSQHLSFQVFEKIVNEVLEQVKRLDKTVNDLLFFGKPTLPTRDDYVFDVIQLLMTEGRTSRLYRKLVTEEGICSDITATMAPVSPMPTTRGARASSSIAMQ